MAERTGTNPGMAFIVGALVVVVGVLAYFVFGGEAPKKDNEIRIELPG